ncbi:MAG: hypothetical protein KI791_03290 [Cyclobacteriaceae bacterium]|nr:hypothetical protein [Cyclobacteriaceae bacterium SS2]
MKLKREILLCYASQDDEPLEGDQRGWVSNFHRFFVSLLSQIHKDVPEVKLIDEQGIADADIASAAATIIIETKALTSDGAILKKFNDFGKQAKKDQSLFVDGVSRILKVHKAPYEDEGDLSEFQNQISYDFYMIDPLSGEAVEFRRFFGNDAERGYWMKLIDMAYDVSKILQSTTKTTKAKDADIPYEKTVYLASTGVDILIQRDVVKRELIRHGYKVLPDHTLPKEAKLLQSMVREDLHKCRLSIHMVGEDYGYRPTGSDLSVVDIQNRLASEHTKTMSEHNANAKEKDKKLFSRLVWLSPDLANVTERQKIFIEDLKSEAATLDEAEVLQITLQELKGIIREELMTGGRFKVADNQTYQVKDDGSKVIYLIHDKEDKKGSKPLEEYLTKQGYRVVAPSFDGDLVDIRYIHQENLRKCDASIIYYGQANEEWIKTKLQDLLKAPGFGRDKQLRAKAVYMEGSKEADLNHFEKNNTMVLGLNGNFQPDHLKPFLNKIGK